MIKTVTINRLLNKLTEVGVKLDKVLDEQSQSQKQAVRATQDFSQAVDYLLRLPDHLRISLLALINLDGNATALQVSQKTGRCRAVESGHLNQLVRLGYLTKEKDGRHRRFFLGKIEDVMT